MTSHTSAALAIAAGIVDALPYDIPRGYRAALKNDIAFALDARRREALEEAARLCEERYSDAAWHKYYRQAGIVCAKIIRSLPGARADTQEDQPNG